MVERRCARHRGGVMTRPKRTDEVIPGLGARLRDLRRTRGLTQERLGELAGVQSETMSRLENAANTPDLDTLARIAKVLNVSVAAMLPLDPTVDDPAPTLTDAMLEDWNKLDDHDKRLVITFVSRLAAVAFQKS